MIYLNLGRRFRGKTTLALYTATRIGAPLLVVFDPRALFPTDVRLTSWSQIDDAFATAEKTGRGRIVVTPGPDTDLGSVFDKTSRECVGWVRAGRALAFIIDESWMVDLRQPMIGWLLRAAPPALTTIILTTHRPTDVPTNVRAIADVWSVFHTTQEHDLAVLKDRLTGQAYQAVCALKDREFVCWDDGRGSHTVYRDPQVWYVQLDPHPVAAPGSVLTDGTAPQKVVDLFGESS